MPSHVFIPPSEKFWRIAAERVIACAYELFPDQNGLDLSGLQVIVATFDHGQQLRQAIAADLGENFVPPRISTLSSLLRLQYPRQHAFDVDIPGNERVMSLYAELRQHGWLKKLFGTTRNTDLLPLAQTILAVGDELTAALLPEIEAERDVKTAERRWDAALAQLPPSARSLLSNESELVWSIWKTQLEHDDPGVVRYRQLVDMAELAPRPLVWISALEPSPIERSFLAEWEKRHPTLVVALGWCAEGLNRQIAGAWPEILDDGAMQALTSHGAELRDAIGDRLSLCPGSSLEEEALNGAQTIVDWLREGKNAIAIVAQDRVVARRIRALLQRAQVQVTDETGWKLSTTRAAATLVAWFDVVTSRAETAVLLDFLKSSFFMANDDRKSSIVLDIETTLRRQNIAGGWQSIMSALPAGRERQVVQKLFLSSTRFEGRLSIDAWLRLTFDALHEFGIRATFSGDAAGLQVDQLLCAIGKSAVGMTQEFSFGEWRAYVCLQLECATFLPPVVDRRVVMLPLSSMHLRHFDAVLMVGADAAHLPSPASETLFFANSVRRELGLGTRESQQRQQLRDLTEMLSSNPTIVLSWQSMKEGDPNPVSPWVARLQLYRSLHPLIETTRRIDDEDCSTSLARHCVRLTPTALLSSIPSMPAPMAAILRPEKLSASGYTSLFACPYQFFATRMLRLSDLAEFSDQPQKRDYGDWLHQILYRYHTILRDEAIAIEQRAALLTTVTSQVFDVELAKTGAALGYLDRWQKAMPAYLKWAEEREAEGWQFFSGEEGREQMLSWEDGRIVLHGRVDRIDRRNDDDSVIAVLDYKTTAQSVLKKRVAEHEDHQLPFYGLLSASNAVDGAVVKGVVIEGVAVEGDYVSLEPSNEKIVTLPVSDYPARVVQLGARIAADFSAIDAGAPLPATGTDATCRYCKMNGLCRKGAW